MGCGCGKPNKNSLGPRRTNLTPNNGAMSPNILQPNTNRTIAPANAQRMAALGMQQGPPSTSANNNQYLSPQRLRIERMRREAIDKALNKQFL